MKKVSLQEVNNELFMNIKHNSLIFLQLLSYFYIIVLTLKHRSKPFSLRSQ